MVGSDRCWVTHAWEGRKAKEGCMNLHRNRGLSPIMFKMSNNADGLAGLLTMSDNTGEYVLGFDCARCEMMVKRRKSKG